MMNFESIDALDNHVGKSLGVSPWFSLSQKQVNAFADTTLDFQGIHLNTDAARASGFDAPIAHGYLLLALLPHLAQQVYSVNGMTSKINYGLDRCRFITPVPADADIRASFTLVEVLHKPKGIQLTVDAELQIRDHDKPAVVARTLALLIP